MDFAAKEIVTGYILDHLDQSDPDVKFEVYVVWKAKVLQSWKYLISSTLPDGMYYELTYNGDKSEQKTARNPPALAVGSVNGTLTHTRNSRTG